MAVAAPAIAATAALLGFRRMINIRQISIKCGHCSTYQTLVAFSRREDWNVYTYECENDTCDANVTRTLVEVPRELDEFAHRDPEWRGGARHGGRSGAESGEPEAG
jgi:hypothetical protein